MSRRTLVYVVTDENRDKGKAYKLTEMYATQGELWAARAFFAMAQNGIEIPDSLEGSGMAGLARFGLELIGKLPFSEAQVLMGEMFAQVEFMPDQKNGMTRHLIEDDIEEISTRVKLRMELLKLHADFLKAVMPSTSASGSTVQ
jgi:hypothetical protein